MMPITTDLIYFRYLTPEDAPALLDLMQRNRAYFEPFTITRPESFYTLEEQSARIRVWTEDRAADKSYNFGIFFKENDELIGEMSLFHASREPAHKCMMGYCLDHAYQGKGIMSHAARLALEFAFTEAGFHRVEAGVMPHNIGSIRVLEKAGFQREGLARKNVKINGVWQDHVMFAILEEDERPRP